jgi:hypothetical protein
MGVFSRFIILSVVSLFLSCSLLEDTDLNPIYFFECEIDGEFYRAQTNAEASMTLASGSPDGYTVTGQDVPNDFHVDLYLFESLGEGKIPVNTNVNSILTSIALFKDNKSYSASIDGGGGYVHVELLTGNSCEGTFEGVVVEVQNKTETRHLTNGRFKVKSRN